MTQEKNQNIRAWVVFSGKTDLPWLRVFKRGFRHCYAVLHDGARWITIDPLSNYTELTAHDLPKDFNLPRWLSQRGSLVIEAELKRPPYEAPWMPFTCVEAVKRILGLHSRFIWTPWQLYRHLRRAQYSHPHIQDPFFKGDYAWEK